MLTKRIIPCLDVKDGRTVKGINFERLRDAGDPVEMAHYYADEGADELVFLDISATNEKRKTLTTLVRKVAAQINIPFTVGGGISSVEDVSVLLDNGADKISVNTSAYRNPRLIDELAHRFGSQCVVLAMDIKHESVNGKLDWYVHLNGGRVLTETNALTWALEAVNRGAGEILLTSMSNDGTHKGFALDITEKISTAVPIPVIASGGAGKMEHFLDVFTTGKADAALAASIFHFNEVSIPGLKRYLKSENILMRI